MEPDTVQTDVVVDAKPTVRPDVAVAERVKGAAPSVAGLRVPNVIDCGVAGTTTEPLVPVSGSDAPLGSVALRLDTVRA